jgi:hypothetical protein
VDCQGTDFLMADRHFLQQLTKRLADEGRLIEAGWVGLRLHVMQTNAPPDQVSEMRLAFMAGAQHLFASIMDALDPDRELNDDDMKRMGLIDKELRAFGDELKLRFDRPAGSA